MLPHRPVAATERVTGLPEMEGLCLLAKPGGFWKTVSPWRLLKDNIHSSREIIWGWESCVSGVKDIKASKHLAY